MNVEIKDNMDDATNIGNFYSHETNDNSNSNSKSNSKTKYEYITLLPNYFFTDESKTTLDTKYITLVKKFLTILKERLNNKIYQQNYNLLTGKKNNSNNNPFRRRKSLPLFNEVDTMAYYNQLSKYQNNLSKYKQNSALYQQSHLTKKSKPLIAPKKPKKYVEGDSCELKLNNIYFKIFNKNDDKDIGGDTTDYFSLQLLISIFLSNVLYNYTECNIYNIIEDVTNIIGINIIIPGHSMSFYKCNKSFMFCTNDFKQLFRWDRLLNFITQNVAKFSTSEIIF